MKERQQVHPSSIRTLSLSHCLSSQDMFLKRLKGQGSIIITRKDVSTVILCVRSHSQKTEVLQRMNTSLPLPHSQQDFPLRHGLYLRITIQPLMRPSHGNTAALQGS